MSSPIGVPSGSCTSATEVACRNGDLYLIRERLDRLNHITQPFAEAILDATIKAALRGKTVEEAEMDAGRENG